MGTYLPHQFNLRPTGSCVVRSAGPDDAPRVLACARDVFATSPHTLTQGDEFTMTEPQEREFIAGQAAHPTHLFVVAFERDGPDEPALGIAGLRHQLPKRKLRHSVELGMSVRSTHRGRGVGTALLAACVEWATAHPELEIMTLGVYAANAAGVALYRRFGFAVYGSLPGGCKHDDGSTWDQLMMYRRVK